MLEGQRNGMRIVRTSASTSPVLDQLRKFVADADESWGYITPDELNEEGTDEYYILE